MKRHVLPLLIVPLLLTACSEHRPPLEEAYAAADAAYDEAKNPEEKVAVAREFLASYPDSEHTMQLLRPAVYYLVERLESPAEADALVVELLDSIETPELRRDVMLERLRPLAALGNSAELATTVQRIAAIGDLIFSENSEVVEAALEVKAWQLAADRAEVGLAQANAETYRADYPDRPQSDDEVRDAVERRLAEMLSAKGWAQANLGRPEDGLATLAEAATHDTVQFTGESVNRIGSYRGQILHRLGRHSEAIDALAPGALYGEDAEAQKTIRAAYEALHGSDDGLEEFLWSTRLAVAPEVVDFSLPDYNGREHTFSSLSRGNVTLLAFWFPT